VSSRNRQREYARKRHEKWLAHQAAVRARRRRRRIVAAAVTGVLALVAAIVVVVDATRPEFTVDDGTTAPTRDVPDASLAEARTWTVELETSAGALTLELDGAAAPQAVASFVTLAQEGFFTGVSCHRLTTSGIFVLQCGDPTGTGSGGPGYRFGPIENAPADDVYPAGTLAMARVGGDGASMGSQFFMVYADSTIAADEVGGYTVFGRVVEGMDVLQTVADAGVVADGGQTPAMEVTIERIELQ
jgi:peptidyl-prolyl cis-trans isomerase B (cyclophilin B)